MDLFGIAESERRYIEHISAQHTASTDSYDADYCVKGMLGSFPCFCKECQKTQHTIMKIMRDVIDWEEEYRNAFFDIFTLMTKKHGGPEGVCMSVLYNNHKKEDMPKLLENLKKNWHAEWKAIPWYKRLFIEEPTNTQ